MSLNKFTSDATRKEWMKLNAKVVEAETGAFETLLSNDFQVLNLTVDTTLTVKDVKYTGDDGNAGDVLTTDGAGNTSFQPVGGGGDGYIGNFGLYEKVVSANFNSITALVSKNLTNNYFGNINSGLTWNVGDSYLFEVSGSWATNATTNATQALSFNAGSTSITSTIIPLSSGGGNGNWRFTCNFSVKTRTGNLVSLVQSNSFQWMNNSDNIQKTRSSDGDFSTFDIATLDITFLNTFNNSTSTIWVYGFSFIPTHKTIQ